VKFGTNLFDGLSRRHDGSLITDAFVCVKIVQSWSHKSVRTCHTGLYKKWMCWRG